MSELKLPDWSELIRAYRKDDVPLSFDDMLQRWPGSAQTATEQALPRVQSEEMEKLTRQVTRLNNELREAAESINSFVEILTKHESLLKEQQAKIDAQQSKIEEFEDALRQKNPQYGRF